MKTKGIILPLIALFTVFAFIGCSNAAGPDDTAAPTVVSSSPDDLDTGVSVAGIISAVFSEAMDPEIGRASCWEKL